MTAKNFDKVARFDELALEIIEKWERGCYRTGAQLRAALQAAIAEALRKVAG